MESIFKETTRCEDLAHPDPIKFSLSLFILVGILASYLPQHVKIILRRSSEGLSPMFVLLGTVSGTAMIANILVLPQTRADIGCCSEISDFACAASLLGIAQVGVQWSCFFLIMLLFLVFFPRRRFEETSELGLPTWKQALAVLIVSMAFLFTVIFASVVVIAKYPSHLQGWANFLGIVGTILASIQYIPQIFTTWRLKQVLSLSIPMMLIQTPGSFVWAYSLADRLGPGGWSAWGLYLITGSLQGCLLVMAITFWHKDREHAKQASLDDEQDANANGHGPSDRTPLLGER